MQQRPLLSICIPTFNRSRFLHSNLLSIFLQIDDGMDVEIVVSDNHSTDDTHIVIEQFINQPKFKYFKQEENLGAIKNILKLVSNYASGEFCWIVGDDDFLLQGALKNVLELLKNNQSDIDYFYSSVDGIMLEKYNTYTQPFSTKLIKERQPINNLEYKNIAAFEELISPDYSIIFLGELMASIFRRDIWLKYSLNGEGEYLSTLETTYPHSVILANTFFGKKAMFIRTPLLLALDGGREWWDKLGYILVVQVKNLLDLYKEKGLPTAILRKCYLSYLRMSFKYFVGFLFKPKSNYRDRISFSKYFYFLFSNPLITSFFLIRSVGGVVRRVFKQPASN